MCGPREWKWPQKLCENTHQEFISFSNSNFSASRKKERETVPICEALPHPGPSREKKGLCVCGEGSVRRVHKYTSAGAGGAWDARLPPLRHQRPSREPGAAETRLTWAPGARAAEEEEDAAPPPGTRGRGRAARTSAGPHGRTSRPLSSASGVAGPSVADSRRLPAVRSARFHARPARTSSGPRAPPRALPTLRPLSARSPSFQRPATPGFPGRRLGKVEKEGEGAATWLSSPHSTTATRSITSVSPAPNHAAAASRCGPPRQILPPPRATRKLPSLPGTTECWTPSRRAKDRRGQPDEQGPGGGQLSLNGRQGCSGAEAGAGPRAPAGRLPAIVYTGCAPRRTRAGRGRGGGGGCVLALAWPGPRATFVVSRGCSPPLREDFFFSSSKERKKEAPHGFAYLFFAKTHNRNFFPAAQM